MDKQNFIEDSSIYNNDPYISVYGQKYIEKIEYLKKVITKKETKEHEFNVLDFESGLGKSYYTNKIIDNNLYDWGNQRTFLVVKRFAKDVIESVEQLKHHNSAFHTTVLGITSENWSNNWKFRTNELKDIAVIFITHERYIRLCLDDELRAAFTDSRHTLIIDEKVNFPIYTYSKKLYDDVRGLLPTVLQPQFDKVCKRLNVELINHDHEKNKVIKLNQMNLHPATMKKFFELLEINDRNIVIEREGDLNKLNDFLTGLKLWYSQKCLYNGGKISTLHHQHRLWGLKNNVILDASANIEGIYKLIGNYNVNHQSRIIDHSNCKFTIINFNSSKSKIRQNSDDYFNELAIKIQKNMKENEKVLIISHKENAELIKNNLYEKGVFNVGVGDKYIDQDVAINWYGNIIGKNTYSYFTQCWLVGTPNVPFDNYLIQYMQYSRIHDLGKKGLDIIGGKFKNDTFSGIQEGYIAAEMYQSIKRIQRNTMPQGEFFIVSSNMKIVTKVLSSIKNSDNRKVVTFEFTEKEKENKAPTKADELRDLLLTLNKGKYSKSELIDKIGVSKTNASKILKDAKIVELVEVKRIRLSSRYIEVFPSA